ncbi:cytochrome c biogenesis protein CcsA [Sanyastnella coralliicola]|uniref:cytochrome c biogenesis protein CcsA n=1 Tax=Sanyastnella coralliicola TaxID=3069118 RepID=UPI0027B9F55D|nr:cytochrome c biogenesis protein CcsA [Longitalea sp. SCSIO 12813]
MEDIVYQGEWTWAATLGRFLIAGGFAAAIAGFIGYLMGALGKGNESWKRFGRTAFIVHAVSFLLVIVLIYTLIFNHRYEFQYIWKHLNNQMGTPLQFSCFWGGQEGGFLLWMFWHIVLALIFIRRRSTWEAPVMAIIASVQAWLACMLLGVYFGDYQFGIDPFLLIREAPENIGLPWTRNAEYLSLPLFADGQGLNPLLQNYWMVIHPPTLFLGFASTLMPFAFAIAGLWKKQYIEWMRPATPWAFFGIMILGTGILMGGAWAYEALSFGGFWAWDPVENSSLVPWLLLVGGGHLLMVNRNKVTSVFSALFLIMGSFILIVYSTFLTKSGILGDTSVHSFVDSGILPQLLVYLLFFSGVGAVMMLKHIRWRWMIATFWAVLLAIGIWGSSKATMNVTIVFLASLAAVLIIAYAKHIPRPKVEEDLWSREFWIFIGSVILLVAGIQISFATSIPVFNKLLEPYSETFMGLHESTGWAWFKSLADHNFAPSTDMEAAYHVYQVPLAFLFIMLIGFTQWLKYKKTDPKKFLGQIVRSFVAAGALLMLVLLFFDFSAGEFPRIALVFATIFAVTSNFDYLVSMVKGKWDKSGSAIAHIGFGLLIFGAVISTSQKDIISQNQMGDITTLNNDFDNREDILLLQGDTLQMGDYFISYKDRYDKGIHVMFEIDYFEMVPKQFKEGDVIFFSNMFFEAKEDHLASRTFIRDMESKWRTIPLPNERHAREAQRWVAGIPGEKLFTLEPRVQLNEQMGNAPEPDTKHFIHQDLYTHIKWGQISPPETDEEGFLGGRAHDLHVGDSLLVSNVLVTIDSLSAVPDSLKPAYSLLEKDIALRVHCSLRERNRVEAIDPLYIIRDSLIVPDAQTYDNWGLKFLVNSFNPVDQNINMTIWEHESIRRDFIVMQAVIFPQINILWLGCIIMIIGTTLAVRHRIKLSKRPKKA